MFPIVQDQWLNIFLLNKIEFSIYSILYFISGFLFPVIVIKNSLRYFFDYKFNTNKLKLNKIKNISYLIFSTVLILSILIIKYFKITLGLIIPQIDLNIFFNIRIQIISSLSLILLLFFNKAKRALKKILLLNFFIICFINWTNHFIVLIGNDIFINKYISDNIYLDFKTLNIHNIIYLFILEILFYLWSFLTYQNNISDWSISYPTNKDLKPIFNIIIFYLGVLTYYIIFNLIS